MRSNRQRDTGPELRLRRSLHARGHRYRVAPAIQLPAGRRVRPDLVFTRHRLAIFIDGCYWHSCPDHGRAPSDPTGYWAAKLRRNVERDIAETRDLEDLGWAVVRVWEHVRLGDAVAIVERALKRS
jgi:DNA mismatch endonuclease (patch repair protein)